MYKILLLKEKKIFDNSNFNYFILNLTINQLKIFYQYSNEYQNKIMRFADKDDMEYIFLISSRKFKEKCSNSTFKNHNEQLCNECSKKKCNLFYLDKELQDKFFNNQLIVQYFLIKIGRFINNDIFYKLLKLSKDYLEKFFKNFGNDINTVIEIQLNFTNRIYENDDVLTKNEIQLLFNLTVNEIQLLLLEIDPVSDIYVRDKIKLFLKIGFDNFSKIKSLLDKIRDVSVDSERKKIINNILKNIEKIEGIEDFLNKKFQIKNIEKMSQSPKILKEQPEQLLEYVKFKKEIKLKNKEERSTELINIIGQQNFDDIIDTNYLEDILRLYGSERDKKILEFFKILKNPVLSKEDFEDFFKKNLLSDKQKLIDIIGEKKFNNINNTLLEDISTLDGIERNEKIQELLNISVLSENLKKDLKSFFEEYFLSNKQKIIESFKKKLKNILGIYGTSLSAQDGNKIFKYIEEENFLEKISKLDGENRNSEIQKLFRYFDKQKYDYSEDMINDYFKKYFLSENQKKINLHKLKDEIIQQKLEDKKKLEQEKKLIKQQILAENPKLHEISEDEGKLTNFEKDDDMMQFFVKKKRNS